MKKQSPWTLVFRAERTHLVSKKSFFNPAGILKPLPVIPICLLHWFAVLPHLPVCISLFRFFGFLAGGFCFGVFVIIWEQDRCLFRVCTAPMELQSVTEDQDNGIIADDNSLRSNFCRGSNCCLSFLR